MRMRRNISLLIGIVVITLCLWSPAAAEDQVSVPVLCYHRFGPTVPDSMTVTTKLFTE
jgi:hypothetical protein